MRKITSCLAAAAAALSLVAVAHAGPAGAAEHPGCRGIDQASSRASTQGRAALAVVSEKFGCGTVTPTPTDHAYCPSGQTELARWSYTGVLSEGVDAHGYKYWIPSGGTNGWTNVSGTGAAPDVNDIHSNAGGFYWSEAVPGAVQSMVLVSFTQERKVLTDADIQLDPTIPISQNWLTNRTGINLVTFCTAP